MLWVLFITELTCCQCLKELSESLAKVTQSLPTEVVSPKGWGLFVRHIMLPGAALRPHASTQAAGDTNFWVALSFSQT